MFQNDEDKMLEAGPSWHGTALGWLKSYDRYVIRLPALSERFCGIKMFSNILIYSAYLPTSGQDDLFLETLSQLSFDVESNIDGIETVIIGLDSNESVKSTKRRSTAMKMFCSKFKLKSIISGSKPTFHHNNQIAESQIDHILFFLRIQNWT